MEHLSNNLENLPNQQQNNNKLYHEMGHSTFNETTWSEFPNGGKGIVKQIKKKINPKEQDCEL